MGPQAYGTRRQAPYDWDKQSSLEGRAVNGVGDLWDTGEWDYQLDLPEVVRDRRRGHAACESRRPAVIDALRDRQGRGNTFASRASASGLPRGLSLPVASARSGSRRSPMMSAKSW